MKIGFEECSPRPEALISSLRSIGYDLPKAVADLIDNSIFADAKNIQVEYDWNEGAPWFQIIDDGKGMNEDELREAMRLGSFGPEEIRQESDLGRFGLGLKTAAFSQGRLLYVKSKTRGGEIAVRGWDLEHVRQSEKWELKTTLPDDISDIIQGDLEEECGTIVLCKDLDRLVPIHAGNSDEDERVFLNKFKSVAKYLEVVFHRFLSGRNPIRICVGRHQCVAWDPFIRSNTFTQTLASEKYPEYGVEIQPYILPHVSKRSEEENKEGKGINGWNAHQGFYVYRNKRMIIPGGYLDLQLTPEEHYKLCRIRLDLSNRFDSDWGIDIRKAEAHPPSYLKRDLERIASAARTAAVAIYRARSGAWNKGDDKSHDRTLIWIRRRSGDKIRYRINTENEALGRILCEKNLGKRWVKKLFHIIESSVPHRTIILDNANEEDCHVNLPPEIAKPPKELLVLCAKIFVEKYQQSGDVSLSVDYACASVDGHPMYRIHIEEYLNELGLKHGN